MVTINLIIFFLAGAAWGVAPTPLRGEDSTPPLVRETMKEPEFRDDHSPIRVKPGEEFSIILRSNPTTGYSWRLAQPLDKDILHLRGSTYRPPRTLRKGAGGEEIWRFTAKAGGTTDIVFEYVRPWEKDKEPARTGKFTVIVAE